MQMRTVVLIFLIVVFAVAIITLLQGNVLASQPHIFTADAVINGQFQNVSLTDYRGTR